MIELKHRIPIYVLVTLIIFSSGGAITTLFGFDNFRIWFRNIIIFLLAIYGLYRILKLSDHAEFLLLLIFSAAFIILNYFTYKETESTVVYIFIRFILLYYLVDFCKDKDIDLAKIVFQIVMAIAVISLIIYVLINVFGIFPPGGIKVGFNVFEKRDYPFKLYYGIYIDRNSDDFLKIIMGRRFVRLSGPFWEPGLLGIYLTYALYYLLFRSKKHYPICAVILVVDIAYTLSTSAIFAAGLIFTVYLLKHRSQRTILIVFLLVVIAGMGIIAVMGKKLGTSSGAARIKDLHVGFDIFIRNLLTGIGYGNSAEFMSHWKNERDSADGFITWLYSFGILGAFTFFYPFVINIHRKEGQEKKEYILFFVLMMIWNITEPITTMSFMSLLFAMEYYDAMKSRNFTLELQGLYGELSGKA